MSLLIKGKDMPISCAECPCYDDMETCFCNVLDSYCEQYKTERHPDCPLVEIPSPHGRLIDRDALINNESQYILSIEESGGILPDVKGLDVVFEEDIENAPVIIEAEE